MSEQKYNACPICGNNMQDGYCLRCAANASSRAKRWRRGDRGGVRPERRYHRAHASPPAPATGRKPHARMEAQPHTKSMSGFVLAIHGSWQNIKSNKTITIDIISGNWYFRNREGRRRRQRWMPKKVSRNELHFHRRRKTIIARIANDGTLVLKIGTRQERFSALRSGTNHRICKECFCISEWWEPHCSRCTIPFK